MNLRPISLALVALLSTAGCVSVEAEAERPAPSASVRSGNVPAAQASTPPAAPPAVHDALGKAEEGTDRASGKKRKKKDGARVPDRRADAVGPPAGVAPPAGQEARNRPRRVAPARPGPPRRAGVPRRAQPRQTYDMRTVCATGRGVASADIVDLCRTTYGR
ncbi:hypothetical protein C5F59_035185 [Streptomyces sp. QL37]|uniref:hypothetical protein n=1 Tax=Streptomyces sp. QL37 TaxID=2093747 RepID=UPI000CF2829D|nr:hypothetical protein [Streptomyces sp. QL37]PPQ61419.1 hypothetical protein C5F59_35665 [Streptomyces sp. QL37]